jgi:hypothetical protein
MTEQQRAYGLNIQWNFPHCIGTTDSKHVQTQETKNSVEVSTTTMQVTPKLMPPNSFLTCVMIHKESNGVR